MSVRSLRRKLDDEGTSFRALRESTRQEHARVMLRNPALSLQATGHALGFRHPSAFHRAFTRWTGLRQRSTALEHSDHTRSSNACASAAPAPFDHDRLRWPQGRDQVRLNVLAAHQPRRRELRETRENQRRLCRARIAGDMRGHLTSGL
jgi:AraC-like DNA-binding protein